MSFKFIKNNNIFKKIFVFFSTPISGIFVFNELKNNFKKSDKILNLGCGTCLFDSHAISKGYNITSIDIYDGSLADTVSPIIYNGDKIPLKRKATDITLLISVLHHVNEQNKLINEAKRVSKKIIIQEDLVSGKFKRKMYSLIDNLMNLEFSIKNNNYHSFEEWKNIFKQNGLNLKSIRLKKGYFLINQGIFVLETD
jgi:ubiquinone/menaquinone biosynthesis C-methylase UbiE